MILYEKHVNYSVFDGEITLEHAGRDHLRATVFQSDPSNRDIELIIGGARFPARLMNVSSSSSIQIAYGAEVKAVLRLIFQYSYIYWITAREEARLANQPTRTIPPQTDETIRIAETDAPLVYSVTAVKTVYPSVAADAEITSDEETLYFREGGSAYVSHLRYERSHRLAVLAKESFKRSHDGRLFCEVCGFSFDIYGERGRDYIEAHHDALPISMMGGAAITSVDALRMVCSNCHRMLHRRHPWITVQQLRNEMEAERLTH